MFVLWLLIVALLCGVLEKKPIANPVKEHDCKAASSSLKEKFCLEQKMTSIRPDEEVKTSKANLLAKVVKNCYSNGAVKEVNTCNANAQEDANKQLGTCSTSTKYPPIMGMW